jgi:hypothetical protein
MTPIIRIRYRKNLRYYLGTGAELLLMGLILLAFLPFLVISFFTTSWIAACVSFPVWFPLWCFAVATTHRKEVYRLTFNEILIFQDRIVINGEVFDPKQIEIGYSVLRTPKFGFAIHTDTRGVICFFLQESLFVGNPTGTSPKTVLEVLRKIKQGVRIDGPVEHQFDRGVTIGLVALFLSLLALTYIVLSL